MIPWGRPVKKIEEVFELFQFSKIGKEKWTEFTFRSKKNKISFEPFPKDLRLKLKQQTEEKDGLVGAAFITDGIEGTIFYDPECTLGALLPLLFHEVVHSLDETLWRAAKLGCKSEHDRRELHFASESRAYAAQHQFTLEMKKKFVGYEQFLMNTFPNIPFFHRALLPDEIGNLYRASST